MKRLKKITAVTEVDSEVELYDLDRVAGKLEEALAEIDDLRYDYRNNSLVNMLLTDVVSGLEKTRVDLVNSVQNHYDREAYEDMEHLYWRIDK